MIDKAALPLLLVLALASFPGCDRSPDLNAAPPQDPSAASREPPPASPEVADVVGDEPILRTLILDSHLMVERNVGVVTRRDGIVESIHAERGDHVKEGQLLAALESRDLQLREEALQLELEKEKSSFDRARRLSSQKIISEEEFELIRLRRDAAQKALESIQYELSKCFIRAPFDGVVSGRHVEKGQVVDIDARRVLFQVTAMSPLLARVYLPEWALFGIRQGQSADVHLTSPAGSGGSEEPDRGIGARVKWINDVVDPASATAEALVEIPPRGDRGFLRPGISVQIQLEVVREPGSGTVVSVPREALGHRELDPGQVLDVGLVSGDGSIERRSILIGFIGDDRVEVRSGLSPGDKIVLEP